MHGITTHQAAQLLQTYGPNELPKKNAHSIFKLTLTQVKSMLVLLLLIAVALSFIVGDKIDGVLILTILLLNILLGVWQEYKASRELEALNKLSISTIRVIRDEQESKIPSSQLVPGDIIKLEPGDKVPADAVLLEAHNFEVNESALTGEALPVLKTEHKDNNFVFLGTVVSSGRAVAKITSTGANTRFGKIATTLSEVREEKTPLEISLNVLGRRIGILAFIAAAVLFTVRIIQGYTPNEVLFTSIALFVAAVPEGLPTIIVLALTVGARRMYKRKTLVRKMNAIESLGATTVICTDKTGTLTQNKMTVKNTLIEPQMEQEFINAAVLCNNSSLVLTGDSYEVLGDTTEGALLLWAKEKHTDLELLKRNHEVIKEIPFSLKTRIMTMFYKTSDSKIVAYVKGAPESVLPLCDLSKERQRTITDHYQNFASQGYRILALAYKETGKESDLQNMKYLGFVTIADPPRPNVIHTIERAKTAGIKIVMITGDNELTARAIAIEIHMIEKGEEVITGNILDELTDEEVKRKLNTIRIVARATPENKLRIIRLFQQMGEVVAVTGDGVNDSLALKQAQVGIAMGQSGTDVAKESSDIVILDDDFSVIVAAVEEGRKIYTNLIKIVRFLLAGNLSELLFITFAAVTGAPSPLLAVQILWINLVTDGLPAMALIVDPVSNRVMNAKPRSQKENLLSASSIKIILFYGIVIAAITYIVFISAYSLYGLQLARSISFSTIIILQMILAIVVRNNFSIFNNRPLIFAIGAVLLSQLLIYFVPPLKEIFKL